MLIKNLNKKFCLKSFLKVLLFVYLEEKQMLEMFEEKNFIFKFNIFSYIL